MIDRRRPFARGVAWASLVSLLATSCGGPGAKPVGPTGNGPGSSAGSGTTSAPDQALAQLADMPDGLDLRLSDGKQGVPAVDHAHLPPATHLSDADTAQLLSRATPIKSEPSDAQAFALRPRSEPAPRTAQKVTSTFPPPASSLLPPAATPSGNLKVLRYMPEGKVPIAPELSVTFSQPMVAVTSQDAAASVQPVRLVPQPKGRWRWLGTRTIIFDPDVRFPMATTFRVEVPAGTKSATGGALAAPTRFTFETPPPSLVASSPNSSAPQHLDVPMFALFDQRIDAKAVFAKLHVTAGGTDVPIQLLDAAEIAKDKRVAALVANAVKAEQDGRWLAFRAIKPLPPASTIEARFAAGVPSAEGPNATDHEQQFAFQTYPPLHLDSAGCGGCAAGSALGIIFNNPLDAEHFDDSQLVVTPAIPGMKIEQGWRSISISGRTAPRTTYTVVVSRALRDDFGQTLGTDETRTFRIGDATPSFFGPSGLVVLDPAAAKPTLDVFTTNYTGLDVKLYAVTPADYPAWKHYLENEWNHDHPPRMPGKRVFAKVIPTTAGPNMLQQTSVDLAPALGKAGLGHVIAVVSPSPWTETYPAPQILAWVESTKLAVDAYVDRDDLVAYASELDSGKPAPGVALQIAPFGVAGKSSESGLATLALPRGGAKGVRQLIARRGDDTAFVADGGEGWGNATWTKQPRPRELAWYVADDRKLYKPGEEVSLKGWLRVIDLGKGGDVEPLAGAVTSVSYTVTDSRGKQLAKGTTTVDAIGGFATKVTLPKTPNLGSAYISLEAHGRYSSEYSHEIQIEEFRRPEFEVTADASQGPFVIGGSGDVTVHAKYFAGGGLPGAPATWHVTASPTSYAPPNRDDFVFGRWVPWWSYRSYDTPVRGQRASVWDFTGKTDALGDHTLHMDFLSVKPALPMSVIANASVTDVNRQQWTASSVVLVHPSSRYVGLRAKRAFVARGTPFVLDVIGVDLDGKATPGAKIDVRAVRVDYAYKKGKYERRELDPQTCKVVAAADAVPCTFDTKEGGTYETTATIVDDKGRANQTTQTFWVSGGKPVPQREVRQEVVTLIPDKRTYAPGDTAQLLAQVPFFPAEAIVSWRRGGIVKTERVSVASSSFEIAVPIVDAMTPNLVVQVDLVGQTTRADDNGDPDPRLPKRAAYAVGAIDLSIPPKQRTLAVTATPSAAKVAPGETTTVAIDVRDAAGHPVADAQAAVIVVDEAILTLAAYQVENPIGAFYPERGTAAQDYYERGMLQLATPAGAALGGGGGAPQGSIRGYAEEDETRSYKGREKDGDEGKMGNADRKPSPKPMAIAPGAAPPAPARSAKLAGLSATGTAQANQAPATTAIAIRGNFNPLAAFAPAVKTDATGKATVSVKMPDNLTRYRIIAIVAAGARQFGKGESAVTARLPLMVRPSPPRFLNFGDTFQLPVVVQNQTDAPMTVRLAVRATNAALTDGGGREVTVPANDRVEVQFPAAAEMAGTARFQFVGTAGTAADAAEVALPVWTPATTEAFATYGVIDDGALRQPIALPGKVVAQFGGLEVSTASTNLASLTDAMLYLVHYPFECAEQRSSRILAIAALRDVLTAFHTKDMPSQAAMEVSVATDIEHLSQMQNSDGGFAFWDRNYPSQPYVTVYVVNALAHAKAKGFAVPQAMFDKAKPYLKTIEARYPEYYSADVRNSISAYALLTRKLIGDVDLAKGQALLASVHGPAGLPLEADGWLLSLFAQSPAAAAERTAIARHATNKVSETAGAANFTTSYGDGAYLLLASDRRVDAVMLQALIEDDPASDLIPKLVTGLLGHRKAGRWLNTQENTFALLALDLYFHTYEKATPDFVARVWLGDDYAGDHAFKGRTTEEAEIRIPMADVASHDGKDLILAKDGKGRMYYRIGMTYAPASLQLDAADYGFVVARTYAPLDAPGDVTRAADGTWHVKAGARVRVKLSMVNENRRYHVALVDPLPAGLEAMNPALATTGPIPLDPKVQKSRGAYWWWYGPWYEHQNLRDERTEAFASLLWEGVHTYSYVARATTPGHFIVPPTKAEEMYMPETFGRSATDHVVIE